MKSMYTSYEHYVKFGWSTNPFTLTISPDLMVGYPNQTNQLLSHIHNLHKFASIIGLTGSGKCLSEDCRVLLSTGEYLTIKEIVLKKKSEILSLREDLKIQHTSVFLHHEMEGKNLYLVKTKSGRKIKVTPEHPFLTLTNNGLRWISIRDLKHGDRIAVPKRLSVFGDEKLSYNRIKLLAYVITENVSIKDMVEFYNVDEKIQEDFRNTIRCLYPQIKIEIDNNKTRIAGDSIGPFMKYLKEQGLWNKGGSEKIIPQTVFRFTKRRMAFFLNRLFSCDALIRIDKPQISYFSSSEELARLIQHLLLRFGILSTLRNVKKKRGKYELIISDKESLKKFINEIGFFGKKSKESKKLKKILKNTNDSIYTFPKSVWSIVQHILNKTKRDWKSIEIHFGNFKLNKNKKDMSANTLRKILEFFESNNISLKEVQLLRNLINSDVLWDEIKLIKKLSRHPKVYDLTINFYQNFVSNDFFVHNTTVLTWLNVQTKAYKKFVPYYVPKAPKTKEELMTIFKSALNPNILDKIIYRDINLFNLSNFIKRKIRKKHLVLLVDEAHEASLDTLEWMRTITDSIPNMTVIFAGLPTFEKFVETQLPTLAMRITTKVYLNSLSRAETEDLIRRRIERAGGDGLKPFTPESVDEIFRITGGFPREIIKVCDQLVNNAASRNLTTITSQFIHEIFTLPKKSIAEMETILSPKQKKILQILNKNPKLSPSQIVDMMDKSDYKNRNNAVRSINNILKRLLKDGLVERQKLGNTYLYLLSGKSKTIFTEA